MICERGRLNKSVFFSAWRGNEASAMPDLLVYDSRDFRNGEGLVEGVEMGSLSYRGCECRGIWTAGVNDDLNANSRSQF